MERNYVYLGIVVAVIVVGISVMFSIQKPEPFCGNNVCDADEGCSSCFSDCKCVASYCSQKLDACVKPKCGNNQCEPLEDTENCCTDCGCNALDYVCNLQLNECEEGIYTLSEERAIQLMQEYFAGRGVEIINYSVIGVRVYNNEAVLLVGVQTDEPEPPLSIVVTNDERVIEVPHHGE